MTTGDTGRPVTLRAYLRRFELPRPALLALAGLLVAGGLLPAAALLWMERALDGVLRGDPTVLPALGGLVAVAAVQAVTQVVRSVYTRRVAWDAVHRLRLDAHAALHRASSTSPAGDRLAALTSECDELQYGVSALVTAARAPVTLLSLLAAAVWLAPPLALRALLLLPLLGGLAWAGGRFVRGLTRRWREARAALVAELADQHNGLLTTLDHDAVAPQLARAEARSRADADARARLEWGKAAPSATLQLGMVAGVAALLASGTYDVAAGRISGGGLVAFALALGMLRDPALRVLEIHTLLARSMAALERVMALVEAPHPTPSVGASRFSLVDLHIPGRFGPATVDIPRGQKVALVGASGAGKSTLLAALAGRLGDPSQPREPAVLLRQEPWIFHRTVSENLDLRAHSTRDEQLAALASVELSALAPRLDEVVGEQADRLSGGERQRLCLARALLTPGRALLLDEATSEVQPALARLLATRLARLDRTVVFATHEPWFPEQADRVLWIEDGAIAGDGSHAALLASSPRYARLWGAPPDTEQRVAAG